MAFTRRLFFLKEPTRGVEHKLCTPCNQDCHARPGRAASARRSFLGRAAPLCQCSGIQQATCRLEADAPLTERVRLVVFFLEFAFFVALACRPEGSRRDDEAVLQCLLDPSHHSLIPRHGQGAHKTMHGKLRGGAQRPGKTAIGLPGGRSGSASFDHPRITPFPQYMGPNFVTVVRCTP